MSSEIYLKATRKLEHVSLPGKLGVETRATITQESGWNATNAHLQQCRLSGDRSPPKTNGFCTWSCHPEMKRRFIWSKPTHDFGFQPLVFRGCPYIGLWNNLYPGGGFNDFLFSTLLRVSWSNLTSMFQLGWNHYNWVVVFHPPKTTKKPKFQLITWSRNWSQVPGYPSPTFLNQPPSFDRTARWNVM